jgi:hypothetical protein
LSHASGPSSANVSSPEAISRAVRSSSFAGSAASSARVAKLDELLFFAVYVTSVALNALFEGDVCWPVWFPFLLRRVDHVYDVGRRPFRREQNGTTELPLP